MRSSCCNRSGDLLVQVFSDKPDTPARTACSAGAPWSEVIGDYFAINWSTGKPEGASVAVPYRGVWFYLDDTCRSAKSTLDLIGHLYALQAGLNQGSRDTLLLIGG